MKMIDVPHKVVSPEQWMKAHAEFLVKEKEYIRQGDALAKQRRELPWSRVEMNYEFDGPEGRETLGGLFEGRSQLIVYHFMLGPEWKEGCPGCSFVADHFDGAMAHLNERDVTLVAASRGPLAPIEAFQKRMGWRFKWVSSMGSNFNFDYHVSFTKEQLATGKVFYNFAERKAGDEEKPGASVFFKGTDGSIYHTYSTYERGLDSLLGTYRFLDIAPKGRNEEGLEFPMAWVRHHDRYDGNPKGDWKPVELAKGAGKVGAAKAASANAASKGGDSCCSCEGGGS